ncbi:DUF4189 domain-containing protein [Nocardia amamiensis]|uniref:DUF4189 domain-containing protein n=1 Tax=Nocardia amamiensis TaxID=404578 RepID=A0ABS0CL07_9NOCA|nr:DUF4189 domain-containing protein [Nocardia amamiensis]MBF6297294.1 DUF4189 domain-containing protein [Nocardia amamiensis]
MRLMGKVGFAVAASSLAVGSVLGAGSANAAGLYAAIAMSGGSWTYGVSTDEAGFDEARAAALANCGAADCEVLTSWANGCGALAESNEGVAAASGPNRAEAERAAYQKLAEITPTAQLANVGSASLSGAKIVEVVCTSNAR